MKVFATSDLSTTTNLSDKLEFDLPNDISKDQALSYYCVYYPEYHILSKLLIGDPKLAEHMDSLFQERFPGKSLYWYYNQTSFLLFAIQCLLDYVPDMKKIFNIKREKFNLTHTLRKSAFAYTIVAFLQVIPLFATTVYNAVNKQDFMYDKCMSTSPNITTILPQSFNQNCGQLPMLMYTKNYPSKPVVSSSTTSTCTGISSGISTKGHFDVVLFLQYIVYASLLLIADHLSTAEYKEKLFTYISFCMQGVFIPAEDTSRTTPDSFMKPWLASCPWIANHGITVCVIILVIVYLISISQFPTQKVNWYIFSNSTQYSTFNYETSNFYHTDYCPLLIDNSIKLTYIKYSSSSPMSAMLQAFLLLITCYGLIKTQKKIYDWIDTDEYMYGDNESTCTYYNIHKYRKRVFSEGMLHDWSTIHIYYKLGYNILYNTKYKEIKGEFKEDKLIQLEAVLQSVIEKNRNTQNSLQSISTNTNDITNTYTCISDDKLDETV